MQETKTENKDAAKLRTDTMDKDSFSGQDKARAESDRESPSRIEVALR